MRKRYEVIQWLMFQMGGVGPMFGQANYFLPSEQRKFPTPLSAIIRKRCGFTKSWISNSGRRSTSLGEYTIADIATYPWVWRHDIHQVKLENFRT